MFLEDPRLTNSLAVRGGDIDVEGLASLLNRTQPSEEEISKTSATLYSSVRMDLIADLRFMMKIGSNEILYLMSGPLLPLLA